MLANPLKRLEAIAVGHLQVQQQKYGKRAVCILPRAEEVAENFIAIADHRYGVFDPCPTKSKFDKLSVFVSILCEEDNSLLVLPLYGHR